jgi:hypothetical protein
LNDLPARGLFAKKKNLIFSLEIKIAATEKNYPLEINREDY